MTAKKVFTGSDHAGFELRGRIVGHLRALGHEVEDLGTPSAESTDYPTGGRRSPARCAITRAAWAWSCAAPASASAWRRTRFTACARPSPGTSRRRGCRARTTTPTCCAWARGWSRRRRRSRSSTPGWTPISRAGGTSRRVDEDCRVGGRRGAATLRANKRRQPRMATARRNDPPQDPRARTEHLVRQHAPRPAELGRAGGADRRGVRGMTSNPTIFEKAIVVVRRLRGGLRKPGRRGAFDRRDLRRAGDRGHPGRLRPDAAGLRGERRRRRPRLAGGAAGAGHRHRARPCRRGCAGQRGRAGPTS